MAQSNPIYFYGDLAEEFMVAFACAFIRVLEFTYWFIDKLEIIMAKSIDFALVADIYDSYVSVDFDIPFYEDFCKGFSNILELMCGTGRVSVPLINAGFPLTCVDYSEDMLKVFRRKLPDGHGLRIVCQDVCRLSLDDVYDLVMIPFNSIAEITVASNREQALQAISNHLIPGGTFFCTLYNPQHRIKSADGIMKLLGRFSLAENKVLVVTYQNTYLPEQQQVTGTQYYEIYDERNHLVEKRCLDICFSIISKEEMLDSASAAGFTLKEIYGDYNSIPYTPESTFMNFVFIKS